MIAFILDYINYYFVLIVLTLLVLLMLVMKPKVYDVDFRPMYITVVTLLLFTILDRMETLVSDDPTFYTERLILSVVCYWLRPALCLGVIYVIVTETKKRILILIPELVNILVMGLAFLPGIGRVVFFFDDGFYFQRGPLGYTVFIVGFLYVFYLLYLVLFRLREKKARETLLIAACSVCIIVSAIAEAAGFLHNSLPSLVAIGCLVYYLTIYFQLTSVDALTGLYNRETFYQNVHARNITAAVSIDMNGLKETNDTQGHQAGDAALAAIAGVIRENAGRDIRGYRMGGDEFVMLFKNTEEDAVKTVCDRIRSGVKQAGCSVSVGYACSAEKTVDELLKLSDERMYAEKDAYYGGAGIRR